MKKFNCVLLSGGKVQVHAEDRSSANFKCALRFGAPAKFIEEVFEVTEKPFDITQHEWSDVIAEIEPESGHTLVIKSHGSWLSFDKDDVIAMAKDRGVTAEDLK